MKSVAALFLTLLSLAAAAPAAAFSCLPVPDFRVGDAATYRFDEAGEVTDVQVTVLQRDSEQAVFAIDEGGERYRVSFVLDCGLLLFQPDFQPAALSFATRWRVAQILDPGPLAFGPGLVSPDSNLGSSACEFVGPDGESTDFSARQVCTARYPFFAENRVGTVETILAIDSGFGPLTLAGLEGKRQVYEDGRVDTIRLLEDEPGATTGVPEAPRELRAIVYGPGLAEVIWSRVSDPDGIAGYELSRAGEVLVTTDATSYLDAAREPDVDYLYDVVTIDGSGARSAPASIIATPFGGLPAPALGGRETVAAPDGLTSTVYSSTAGEIFWAPPSEGAPVGGYRLSRDGEELGRTDGTSWFDDDLSPGRRYDYQVVALGPLEIASDPAFGNIVTPGTASASPEPMTPSFTLEPAVYSSTALELFWDVGPLGSTGARFDVYRDERLVAAVPGQSWFTDALEAGRAYSFRVVQFDAANRQVATSERLDVTLP